MSKKLDNDEKWIKKACCSNTLISPLCKQKHENIQKNCVLHFTFWGLRTTAFVTAYKYKAGKT